MVNSPQKWWVKYLREYVQPVINQLPQAVASYKEIVQVRPLDVLILGVGTNGVIGWIFPDSPKDGGELCSTVDTAPIAIANERIRSAWS